MRSALLLAACFGALFGALAATCWLGLKGDRSPIPMQAAVPTWKLELKLDLDPKAEAAKALRDKRFAEEAIERIHAQLNGSEPLSPQDKQTLRSELAKAQYDAQRADRTFKLILERSPRDPSAQP